MKYFIACIITCFLTLSCTESYLSTNTLIENRYNDNQIKTGSTQREVRTAEIFPYDSVIENTYNTGQFRIGSTKQQVRAVGIFPHDSQCIKQKTTVGGVIELWDFYTKTKEKVCTTNLQSKYGYALVFEKGVLIEIRTARDSKDLALN